ncbi:hypothetical protein [Streptomyces sp. NPDC059874]|uniref:hypothetical protein n=1 Tax=Streptomyces sp. NPDC059874 TaxID=3346983 RepID=UPI00364E4E03
MVYAYDRELVPWAPVLPPVDLRDPVAAQEHVQADQFQRPLRAVPDGLWVWDTVVPGPAGAAAVPVRVYEPTGRGEGRLPLPAILYFHAGGFVTGDLETGHDECARTRAPAARPRCASSPGSGSACAPVSSC